MPTAVAPSASALTMSAPERTPGVEQDRTPGRRLGDAGQAVERGQAAVGLPAAVVGDVDAVGARVDGAARVVGVADALEHQRQRASASAARPGRPRSADRRTSSAQSRRRPSGCPPAPARAGTGTPGRTCSSARQRPRSCGKLLGGQVAWPPAGDPGVQGDHDGLEARSSARRTRLSASSGRSGMYSWKNPGVSPNPRPPPPSGRLDSVEATIGTPAAAAASAVARSPCPSWAHSPMTPIGARNTGVGSRRPNRSTDRSRWLAPTSIRGIRPHWLERGDVGALGVLVARAARHVGQHRRRQRLRGPRLQLGERHRQGRHGPASPAR